ncbi:helix-turn-helix domain-containing protein [Hoyosella altamirensis]|uniref:Helix-turn-helix domain-containing protein n=1 Tax=Hoyosella altamirensis TaxID=616997 RepID=A0A839RVZ9_9ACTN|nr:helix-turn-helix domain-containing protein [Hoyosella altamirensis]MBB3040023.1 hypothetical protein [Hoyosella altamirensis]
MSSKARNQDGVATPAAGKHKARRGRAGRITGRRPAARRTVPALDQSSFSAVIRDVLGTVPESTRQGFVQSVMGNERETGLDASLWGAAPSPAEQKQAALENLRRQYEARRAIVDTSLTRTEAAELLSVSEQAILDRLETGDLVGLKKGREWRLPPWQFSPDTERGFVPGVAQLRHVYPGGAVSLTQWATTPNAELDGATPAEELAAGRIDAVLKAAETGTSAAW